MFKWPREETKPIADDANRFVAKSSERGEPPCDVEQIEELARILGRIHESDLHFSGDDCPTNGRSASQRVQQSSLRQLIRPRRPLSVLRSRAGSRQADCASYARKMYVIALAVIWAP